MARIKIKHKLDPNDRRTKQKLLEALANTNINICNLISTHDGGIVAVTANDNDADTLLNYNNVQQLNKAGFDPMLPPEVKSRRTVICQRVDELIYEHSKNDIEDEIQTKNDWAKVKNAFKFPRTDRNQYTIKIEFEDASMAAKAENDGIRLFNMSIANHQIKREKYTPITTCMRCYKIELHPTSQCPLPTTHQICSECGGQDHTWKTCTNTQKCCLNCGQSHRTLAMSCPNRKEAIKIKERSQQQQQTTRGTYAQVANNSQTSNIATPMDLGTSTVPTILFCLYSAHLMNAAIPGSYQDHLDFLTKANNLPRLIGPQNSPSSDIINSILSKTIPRTHPNPQQSTSTEQQEEETEENSSPSESEDEENNLTEEENIVQTRTSSADNNQKRQKKNKKKKKKDNSQRTMSDTEAKSKNNLQTQPSTSHQPHNLPHNTPTPKDARDPRLRNRQQ
ncbi:hypothetical protein Pmani_001484 [Petrolisthes manimaculis]|uniref:Uncharacterized protein n=1 Tax=Petrolisthes manimaculis TaxID=1843537 RepID=A0AAE1URF9_9EUCA|nr:hypothetical protein Pmani_001484 [Petrolisthes manimaculis]